MNNQHFQIILGLLLIAVYMLCIRNNEGYRFPWQHSATVSTPELGKQVCMLNYITQIGNTIVVATKTPGGACPPPKVSRTVIGLIDGEPTYKSHHKGFKKIREYRAVSGCAGARKVVRVSSAPTEKNSFNAAGFAMAKMMRHNGSKVFTVENIDGGNQLEIVGAEHCELSDWTRTKPSYWDTHNISFFRVSDWKEVDDSASASASPAMNVMQRRRRAAQALAAESLDLPTDQAAAAAEAGEELLKSRIARDAALDAKEMHGMTEAEIDAAPTVFYNGKKWRPKSEQAVERMGFGPLKSGPKGKALPPNDGSTSMCTWNGRGFSCASSTVTGVAVSTDDVSDDEN